MCEYEQVRAEGGVNRISVADWPDISLRMYVGASPFDVLRIATQPVAMMHTSASASRYSSAFGSRRVFVLTARHELVAWVHQVSNRRNSQCMRTGVKHSKNKRT